MGELKEFHNYSHFKAELDKELGETAERFVRIGYLLKVARDTDVLAESGYKNVTEFAKAEYGINATAVSRFISINDKFAEGGYSPQLKEQYRGFGYAKLGIMLTLPDAVNEAISPEYTKAEITAIKKEFEAEQKITPMDLFMEAPEEVMEVHEETSMDRTIKQLGHDDPELFARVLDAFQRFPADEAILEEMAPDGERSYFARIRGVGRKMLTVSKKKVTVIDARSGQLEQEGTVDDLMLSWAQLGMDPEKGAAASWEECYGETFPIEYKKPEKKSKVIPFKPKEEKSEQRGADAEVKGVPEGESGSVQSGGAGEETESGSGKTLEGSGGSECSTDGENGGDLSGGEESNTEDGGAAESLGGSDEQGGSVSGEPEGETCGGAQTEEPSGEETSGEGYEAEASEEEEGEKVNETETVPDDRPENRAGEDACEDSGIDAEGSQREECTGADRDSGGDSGEEAEGAEGLGEGEEACEGAAGAVERETGETAVPEVGTDQRPGEEEERRGVNPEIAPVQESVEVIPEEAVEILDEEAPFRLAAADAVAFQMAVKKIQRLTKTGKLTEAKQEVYGLAGMLERFIRKYQE